MKMKKIKIVFVFLTVLMSWVGLQAFGQSRINNSDVNKFKVYTISGVTLPYTDVQASEPGYSAGLGISFTSFDVFEISADIQKGLLQEGHKKTSALGGARYKNDFINGSLVLKVVPIHFLSEYYKELKEYLNISIGGGVSLIKSDVDAIDIPMEGIGMVGNYNRIDVLFPIEISYSIPVYKSLNGNSVTLGVNYRYYYSTTDYLDGYKPTVTANEHYDVFSQTSLTVNFSF